MIPFQILVCAAIALAFNVTFLVYCVAEILMKGGLVLPARDHEQFVQPHVAFVAIAVFASGVVALSYMIWTAVGMENRA